MKNSKRFKEWIVFVLMNVITTAAILAALVAIGWGVYAGHVQLPG